jgi:sulfur relay (sulfurtransferase) DsrF/TusC family protein
MGKIMQGFIRMVLEKDDRTGDEHKRWIELAQDRVQCCALVWALLTLRFPVPQVLILSKKHLREIGLEEERWLELDQDHVYLNKSEDIQQSIILITARIIVLYEFVICHVVESILKESTWKEVAEENV